MKDYIVKITRNIGIGKDIVNFFENRDCHVIYNNQEVTPRTIGIRTNLSIEDLMKLEYIENAIEAPVGRLNV